MSSDREALRARVFLRSVLPLLEVVIAERPELARSFAGVTARAQVEVEGRPEGACLHFRAGALTVEHRLDPRPEVRATFRDLRSLNAFFAGKPAFPRLQGLRHPVLLAKLGRLLMTLQILQPQESPGSTQDRALRVKLLLYVASHALGQLHVGGYPPMLELARESPERVYQWSVAKEGIGAYLRMHRGRIKAGRGTYQRRQPFVHFAFPDADAALSVLTESGSQMDGVRLGRIQTLGCPEYSRKIGWMMQKLDELLVEG